MVRLRPTQRGQVLRAVAGAQVCAVFHQQARQIGQQPQDAGTAQKFIERRRDGGFLARPPADRQVQRRHVLHGRRDGVHVRPRRDQPLGDLELAVAGGDVQQRQIGFQHVPGARPRVDQGRISRQRRLHRIDFS